MFMSTDDEAVELAEVEAVSAVDEDTWIVCV
jgi:hypothetical protein